MTENGETNKTALNMELPLDLVQRLRIEAMQRTIDQGRRVSMVEIVKEVLEKSLPEKK